MSLLFDIGEKARGVARFLESVHRALQDAFEEERATRKLTQQQIAKEIGVNRSVVNRQFLGGGNLTLRRVAELALAMGREPILELRKPKMHGNYPMLPNPEPAPVPSERPRPTSELSFERGVLDEALRKANAPVPTV
jgi:transcriptional regulator with XRE-family HTH domain